MYLQTLLYPENAKKRVNFLTKEVRVLDCVVVLKAELFFLVLLDLNNLFTWFVLYILLT